MIHELEILVNPDSDLSFHGIIICDLLSHVIAHAQPGQVWITHHTHPNIIAVAVLKELKAVFIAGGGKPDLETIRRARDEGIALYAASVQAYELSKVLSNILEETGGMLHGTV